MFFKRSFVKKFQLAKPNSFFGTRFYSKTEQEKRPEENEAPLNKLLESIIHFSKEKKGVVSENTFTSFSQIFFVHSIIFQIFSSLIH